jgi:hypothetical protein
MKTHRFVLLVCTLLISIVGFTQVDVPDEPEFVSASVVPESEPSQVILKWNPSDSIDVAGYIIYEVINNITESVDTVWGRLNNECTYDNSGSGTASEIFRIAAFDDLFFKSSITDPHTTMFLDSEYDKCSNRVDLDWSFYTGWPAGVNKYNIYRRLESGVYQIVSSVASSVQTYIDEDVDLNETYLYYIEAVSTEGYRATSNSVKIESESYLLPSYLYAEFASVSGDDISLKFVVDNTPEVLEYRIQRASTADGNYSTIKSFTNASQFEIFYTDSDVLVDENMYYYRIASVNPCGIINSYSNYASNILLNVETADDLDHDLEWTQYQEWEGGVFNYRIYRYFDDIGAEIAVNTSGDLSYSYDIDWYVDYCHDRKVYMTNKFCYYVEAYENVGHTYSTNQGVSRSNVSCVYHEPVVWFPNAFNLTSYEEENREFKPVVSFAQKEPYEFIIYDKWGLEIFRTEDSFAGWNGSFNYSVAPAQVYTYLVRYYDHKNKEYLKTGTFFMMVE